MAGKGGGSKGGGSSGGAGAGGYAQAMLGVVDLMTGWSADAAYDAAYGPYYQQAMGKHNAARAKVAAEANISAITQDRINTDRVIAMHQDQAEAQAKVAAAVSGTSGGSVDSVIYQTEVNSALATANNRQRAEQQVENQLAQVYQSQSTLLAPSNAGASPSVGMAALSAGVQFMSTNGSQFMEGIDNLFGTKKKGSGDTGIYAVNYKLPDSNGPQLT
jgi:hypothetical protein